MSGPSETKGGHGTVGANGDKKKAAGKKSIVGIEREKERRREEDTETLLARIGGSLVLSDASCADSSSRAGVSIGRPHSHR